MKVQGVSESGMNNITHMSARHAALAGVALASLISGTSFSIERHLLWALGAGSSSVAQ